MTVMQKIIKYAAIALALILCVGIIGGILRCLFGIGSFIISKSDNETKSYIIDGNTHIADDKDITDDIIQSLEIKLNAASLEIKSGDVFKIDTDNEQLHYKTEGNVLKIYETKFLFNTHTKGTKVTLTIPQNTVFKYADLDMAAGQLTADGLSADRLNIDLGAGKMQAENINATVECEIDGGAGQIVIKNSTLNNADIDLGVGEFVYQGTLSGKSEIDSGVGGVNVELSGDISNYTFEAESGLGSITVDGKKLSDDEVYGFGENKVELSGGMGAVNIKFEG